MINNERQYNNQNSANVRYKNDYVGIDTENKVAQNAYAYEDENLQIQLRNMERVINESI